MQTTTIFCHFINILINQKKFQELYQQIQINNTTILVYKTKSNIF